MSIATMTGLQIMQAFAAGKFPKPSIAETIPMDFSAVEHGGVTFSATANDRHLNPMGGVHGGFAATVMDSVTGCAVHTTLGPGEGYATVDLNVKMVRPIPQNVELKAEGRVINHSKSLSISEGTLTDSDGKLYAHSTASCMIIQAKK
jgi:uncharacterized protein (TIGR00369 family)